MRRTTGAKRWDLGAAQQAVMDFVWTHGAVSAQQCRRGLRATWPMKDSTVRTLLLRLEQKGYLTHTVDGRAFIYQATTRNVDVAARTVKHLIQRFCGGSAEQLVLGLVEHKVLTEKQLRDLLRQISAAEEARK